MPPFLGQGMCSGIRDAHNLVWKLALVARGLAPDALLDTYQEERAPHVRTIIETAVTLGGLLQTTDPEVAAARDAAMLAPDAAPPERTEIGGLTSGVIAARGGRRHRRRGRLRAAGGRAAALPGDLASWWAAIGGRTVVRAGSNPAVLVRPDGYCFGEATDPVTLLAELRAVLYRQRAG